jgi:hypothetical protein
MTDDLRKDLLAIVLEEAFGYDETRIRNWLAGRFDHNVRYIGPANCEPYHRSH